LPDVDDPYLRRLSLFAKLSKDFNPDQPRDGHGRWTSEDGSGASAAFVGPPNPPSALSLLGRAVSAFLRRLAPITLDALETVATRFSAATAFFGIIFIPTNRSLITSGTLPDSDVRFSYDEEAHTLTLFRFDENRQKQIVTEARPDADGILRDSSGRGIGRVLDGSVILEPQTIGDPVLDRTVADDDPRLCPPPVKDRPGANRDKEAQQYQAYVSSVVNPLSPLPPGLAVRLWNPETSKWVYYDDCRLTDGTMIDAKYTYSQFFTSERREGIRGFIEAKMLNDARRQVSAAGARPIEWYFAERGAVYYARSLFQREGIPIKAFWLPWSGTQKRFASRRELVNSVALILMKARSVGRSVPAAARP
jgi:hypothetical protein